MAILEVTETWAGRTGSYEAKKAKRDYERHFYVLTNSITDGPETVLLASGVPPLYSTYFDHLGTVDIGCVCRKITQKQRAGSPFEWEVVCYYSSETEPPQFSVQQPTQRPTKISISFAQFQRSILQDQNGTLIANSAGDPFDPPVQVDDSRPVLTFVRNETSYNFQTVATYKDAVNSDAWLGFSPGCVKCSNISAQSNYENGQYYFEMTYEFHVRLDGFELKLLDQGLRKISSGKLVAIRDTSTGQAVSKPALLDGNGNQLAQGGTPVYRNFTVYSQQPFAALNLP